ncbi:MAG: GDP-mannose 4,6-dehydratase, partial [Syntrophothermus sp.]|uniref:GDP-mannose 4,6-dehydratase n=1 Tax=Syntrophothermus sp. TaxID=2736299 RepID=UPI002579D293
GYKVYGTFRRTTGIMSWRLEELGILDKIKLVPMDLLELTNIMRVIEDIRPDEVYNLAALSFVALSFEQPILTCETNAIGTLRLLESVRTVTPKTKFYQASSSEMFGRVLTERQNEDTPFYPRSPYGVSKLFAHWITVNYREAYSMFAVSGILFNHESPLRGEEFVTRKISKGVARIKLGLQDKLVLGNLEAKRDWGYAPEYVEAIYLMMQQDEPDTYIIATGENHSVREFVQRAFEVIDIELEWEGKGVEEKGVDKHSGKVLVEVSSDFFRPAEVNTLLGDYSKVKDKLGWRPKTSFEELVRIMVEKDIERERKKTG